MKCQVCGRRMHLEPKKVLDASVCYVCECGYWVPVSRGVCPRCDATMRDEECDSCGWNPAMDS